MARNTHNTLGYTRKFQVYKEIQCLTVRTTDRINFPGHFAQQQRLKIHQTHTTYNHSIEKSQWEHINAKFDTDYTDLKKSESTNILAIQVREHLNNKYQNHIKIFTDGSVLDSLDSGAGFVISKLKVQK